VRYRELVVAAGGDSLLIRRRACLEQAEVVVVDELGEVQRCVSNQRIVVKVAGEGTIDVPALKEVEICVMGRLQNEKISEARACIAISGSRQARSQRSGEEAGEDVDCARGAATSDR
jgi:UDP-N-acetylglucosamine transferase subunit ALG13